VVGLWWYSDGEASPCTGSTEIQSGQALTSALGYALNTMTTGQQKNPTDESVVTSSRDFARMSAVS